jgi:hypothetical protein
MEHYLNHNTEAKFIPKIETTKVTAQCLWSITTTINTGSWLNQYLPWCKMPLKAIPINVIPHIVTESVDDNVAACVTESVADNVAAPVTESVDCNVAAPVKVVV